MLKPLEIYQWPHEIETMGKFVVLEIETEDGNHQTIIRGSQHRDHGNVNWFVTDLLPDGVKVIRVAGGGMWYLSSQGHIEIMSLGSERFGLPDKDIVSQIFKEFGGYDDIVVEFE